MKRRVRRAPISDFREATLADDHDRTTVPSRIAPPDVTVADDIAVGDVVRLRKPHPCGADGWRVVRIGAEVGLRCVGCDRKVVLLRRLFRRQYKARLARAAGGAAPGSAPEAALDGGDGP